MHKITLLLLLFLSTGCYTICIGQQSNVSVYTIYKVGDDGLLDKQDIPERKIVKISSDSSLEHWHFFFEEEEIIAYECIYLDLPYTELIGNKNNTYSDYLGRIKLSTFKREKDILLKIKYKSSEKLFSFTKEENCEACPFFEKIISN
ncbi:hypothetical protein [Flammeovirga kamogawensis]|uniref:Lipoprotein n=1 Tax=Flammeovirga kamogawensis TaxID=373891 RepID=A0ABX8GSV4_9BACT|nr:hypothetical protein [Flammeovirga kamogawensis]MBB6463368.1 hypothetical protein [Flammeovirga kamogawensis]QWG06660.1 hypothetical protein KM029_15285 [Flammeovirga kamogawensis]TRX68482.1 hypothetical protein EO216_10280 [Flammeovirga kamogawensis]